MTSNRAKTQLKMQDIAKRISYDVHNTSNISDIRSIKEMYDSIKPQHLHKVDQQVYISAGVYLTNRLLGMDSNMAYHSSNLFNYAKRKQKNPNCLESKSNTILRLRKKLVSEKEIESILDDTCGGSTLVQGQTPQSGGAGGE